MHVPWTLWNIKCAKILHYSLALAAECITLCSFLSQVSYIPPYMSSIDFRVYYARPGFFTYSSVYYTFGSATQFNYTLSGLERNTTYKIYIRAEGSYSSWCWYNELIGNYSESVNMTTNAVGKFRFETNKLYCVLTL